MNMSIEEKNKLERARKKVKSIRGFYKHLTIYLIINILALLYTYFKLETGEEFFVFKNFNMAFFWGIGVIFHALGVFGTGIFFGSDWEDRKIRELMDKEKMKGKRWE